MEEDLEIERLYEEHGQLLMEAAATEPVENEEERSTTCGEGSGGDKIIGVENGSDAGKKNSWHKSKGKLKVTRPKRKKHIRRKKVIDEDDSSVTDFEELLDARIVSFIADGGMTATRESDDEFYTGFDGKNGSCMNEILGDEYVSRERSPELERTHVENNGSSNSNNSLITELTTLRNMIDKREDILIKLERELKEELSQNESEQRRVREATHALLVKDNCKLKEPNLTKFYFKKFGIPYFHDSSGFPPPPNNDTKIKLKTGELVMTLLPKLKYWRRCDKDTLQDAIQNTLISENLEKTTKEIDKLKGMLKKVPDEQTEKDILNNIVERQKKLKKIRCMSFLDLVANEKPDREYDWLKYSASELNGSFSAGECRRFWHLYLNPVINKARWERSEDKKLVALAKKMNFQDWESIAQSLNNNRNAYQCLIHYRNRLCDKQDFVVGKWTKEEDEKLMHVINCSKIGDFIPWTKVATFMGNRTHNQVYNRYVNSLNPQLLKGKFTMEEDVLIVSGIEVFEVTYKELASLMNNRTPNQIRERYERHLLPKKIKIGTFSLEEDEQLLKLVDKHGEKNFALVAKEMKTRSRTQVRQRYNSMMEMMRTKPGWTPAQVKRRSVHNVSKSLTRTQIKVDKIRKEVERVEKEFVLTKLERDTFRIEKLKELCNNLFKKKYDIAKLKKKKVITEHTQINNQLIEFFRYQHSPLSSSIRKNSVNNAAYLNEIYLLAKYFGHDLQLPESEHEIWENNNLSYNLKSFLVETLKQQAVSAVCDKPNAIETSSTSGEESHNIDYVEPEIDNTLILEESWYNGLFRVTNLNFSEVFKRTVFDYSNGMHQDIWCSKIMRSKVAMLNEINDAKPQYEQQYFFPPNSITALGYKSILLSRNRLKRDANNLREDQMEVEAETSPTDRLQDEFQETLLSLFYCPQVLSVTDITSTLLPPLKRIKTSVSMANCDDLVRLLHNYNQYRPDIVKKVTNPIKDDSLRNKKVKRSILEHNKTRQRQLKEFKMGITFNRKMSIEHLVTNGKKSNSNFSNTQTKLRTSFKKKIKQHDAKFKAKELKNGSNTLKTNGYKGTKKNPKNKFDSATSSSAPVCKVPTLTYAKTRQSLKRHSESDKHSKPALKKCKRINSDNTKPTQPATREVNNVSLKSLSKATSTK